MYGVIIEPQLNGGLAKSLSKLGLWVNTSNTEHKRMICNRII